MVHPSMMRLLMRMIRIPLRCTILVRPPTWTRNASTNENDSHSDLLHPVTKGGRRPFVLGGGWNEDEGDVPPLHSDFFLWVTDEHYKHFVLHALDGDSA